MISRMRMTGVLLTVLMLVAGAGLVFARPQLQSDPTTMLLAARTDLEALANASLGDRIRPAGWTNTYDADAVTFAIDLRLDLENLAAVLVGTDQRPSGWFGAQPGIAWAMARDIRHDLELLAATVLEGGSRPDIWIGADPILQCDRDVQATVFWLQRTNAAFTLTGQQAGTDYCTVVEQQIHLFVDILLPGVPPGGDLRTDLNALSRELFRADVFPEGWTNNKDAASIRQDLESLRIAGRQWGSPVDEDMWFGAMSFGADWVIARGNRHDLEVLADAKLGFGQRPPGWTLFDPLVRCSYTTQNLVALLKSDVNFSSTADVMDPAYCEAVSTEASAYVEQEIMGPQRSPSPAGQGGAAPASSVPVNVAVGGIPGTAVSPNAYLDHGARMKIGVIPRGTPFTALARSSAPDSQMMYITGEGFHVWAGWRWTSMTEAQYLSLPLAESVEAELPQLLCFASFCSQTVHYGDPLGGEIGFGDGALLGAGGLAVPGANLQYIDYAHVRLLFNEDHPVEGYAQLRIQICPNLNDYNTCEPVLRLIEHGSVVSPLRVENGHPVWQLTYNLHETARLESRRFYANQLWVTHPDDRR